MKKILSIICLACLFSACSSDDPPEPTSVLTENIFWTNPEPFSGIKKASAIWEFICDYILYDGTKGTFHILLNIDTGHYELK